MKRAILVAALFLAFAAPSRAASITVSGDINIIDGVAAEPGNRTFFRNLLDFNNGSDVLIRTDTFHGGYGTILETFYDSLAETSAGQVAGGAVTAAGLTGVDLFIGLTSTVAYTPSEIAALSAFLGAGGSVMIFGEAGFFATENAVANSLLAALGSSLVLGGSSLDPDFHQATGAQITSHPLAAGVSSLTYAFYAPVSGGNPVFFGVDLTTAIVASEIAATQAPEPSALLLLSMGALAWQRRRRTRRD